MVEFSLNPIKYITRVWGMGKLGHTLVISCFAVTIIAVYIGFSTRLNSFGLTAVWVITIGSWVVLGIVSEIPRLNVVFGGGSGGWAKIEFGDATIHDGGYRYGMIATISNIGGRKLTLETKAILRDRKTGKNLCHISLMPDVPLSEQKWAEKSESSKFVATQPLCPQLLELKPYDTTIHKLYFFVDKIIVERLGSDAIANNTQIQAPKVATAEWDLLFIDRGLGIMFDCTLKGQSGNEYKCRRLRLH